MNTTRKIVSSLAILILVIVLIDFLNKESKLKSISRLVWRTSKIDSLETISNIQTTDSNSKIIIQTITLKSIISQISASHQYLFANEHNRNRSLDFYEAIYDFNNSKQKQIDSLSKTENGRIIIQGYADSTKKFHKAIEDELYETLAKRKDYNRIDWIQQIAKISMIILMILVFIISYKEMK